MICVSVVVFVFQSGWEGSLVRFGDFVGMRAEGEGALGGAAGVAWVGGFSASGGHGGWLSGWMWVWVGVVFGLMGMVGDWRYSTYDVEGERASFGVRSGLVVQLRVWLEERLVGGVTRCGSGLPFPHACFHLTPCQRTRWS